jgi:hypothetical protein
MTQRAREDSHAEAENLLHVAENTNGGAWILTPTRS